MIPYSAGDDDAPRLDLSREHHPAERVECREDGRADLAVIPYGERVPLAPRAIPVAAGQGGPISGSAGDSQAGMSRALGGHPAEKFAPPVVINVVARPRLHAALPAGSAAQVTVVAAAAGWGKTIFAASWLAAVSGRSGAWVSLDEADDDPHAFWSAVASALLPVVGARAAEALRPVTAGAVETDDLPRAVAAALHLAPGPIALALDNLHEIKSPEVHDGLVRLVERRRPTGAIYRKLGAAGRRDAVHRARLLHLL
jgi:ATP/maltotriose-dependent transcriptional regulator MalT